MGVSQGGRGGGTGREKLERKVGTGSYPLSHLNHVAYHLQFHDNIRRVCMILGFMYSTKVVFSNGLETEHPNGGGRGKGNS